MKTQNKVQLIGYVGKDPIITVASNGSKRARIQVATDTFFKNQQGEHIKKTAWHTIIAWDRKAEYAENNFLKGSHILIEGQIHYRSFTGTEGKPRHISEIKANLLMNLDR
jgi:single-strand DNA-binding protein